MATPTHGPFAGAYLASIAVENLRCFGESQRLDLLTSAGHPARWTLLLGENGTGKSTLLQAIAAASLNPHELNPSRSPEGAFAPRGFPTLPPQHQGLGPALLATTVSATLRVQTALESEPLRTIETSLSLRAPDLERVDEDEPERFALGTPAIVSHWFGYGPQRRLGVGKLSGETPDPLAALFSADVPLVNAEEWFLQRDYASSNPRLDDAARARASKTRDRIEALLKSVLPGVEHLAPVMVPASDLGQFRLYASTPYGSVPVAELGYGYQSTLAWVVDLAARMIAAYPESEDPLAEPAVVLVDEIDLHLHPKWQRTLLSELTARFPNVQFIATAHSPLIVQAAPDANVVVLRREGDHVVIDRMPESVRNWRVDQILTSDLFGLPSARPAELDAKFRRREEILRREAPTADERTELARLHDELSATPAGESRALLEAEEIMLALTRERIALEKRPKSAAKSRGKVRAAPARRRP